MPVRKFRSVADMPPPPLREPGTQALFDVVAGHWRAGALMADLRFPPGVYRHASVESLNARTDAWEAARIERARRRNASARAAENLAPEPSRTPDPG
jgi:hypothetical protein